ncbi:hypothetical protein LTR53_010582 [Teratosphaeriaceae sp. CCFEE 6253]|nr:hypothetical protein LTR53_010582 [Teratosphaeriaceae sp. CCFEE 6253]
MTTDPTSETNAITRLEELTCRRIGIDFDENDAHGKLDDQFASPLFAMLPREVRDLIWVFATAPFEDPNAKFEENAYYYRPGHTACFRTDTTLLRTCRRVWLEANALPMLQAEHSFYYNRAAPDKRDHAWMGQLTPHNWQNFGHLRLYVQMYLIEGLTPGAGRLRRYFLRTSPEPGDFQPRMLHVTLRHTDWWDWESDEPLHLQYSWVEAMLNSPDLRSTHIFKLELETLDYKLDQLLPIVERLKRLESQEFETHLVDGKPTGTQFVLSDTEHRFTWDGPANLNNETFDPYEGKSRLKYQVITLTWKLHFPDHSTSGRRPAARARMALRRAGPAPQSPSGRASAAPEAAGTAACGGAARGRHAVADGVAGGWGAAARAHAGRDGAWGAGKAV